MPYRNLTSEQLDAVKFGGNLLLTACPGSGKTKTLVSKLCFILENKDLFEIGKKKIVALTYTNVAADTILERIVSYGINSDSLWIGTIHSFCLNWIVKPNIDRIPRLCKGFNVIDEYEKEFILNDLRDRYNLSPYDKIDTLLDLSFTPIYSRNTAEYSVVKAYHAYLHENRLIDFDLILNLTCNLLLKSDVLCERLSLIMRYILVDEYQDTSHIQYEILRLIVSKRNSLVTFIGDKEQAIYTGLGAVVKNRKELFDYFNLEELAEMRLTGCFRSSQSIIDFYSKYKDDAYYINSLSELKTFPSVILKENSVDITQLSVYVSGIIKTHLEQGISPGEIAVLCPGWFDVIKLSNEIISLNSDLDIDGVMVSPIPKNNENLWLNLVKLALIKKNPSNYLVRQKLLRDLLKELNDLDSYTKLLSPKKIIKEINKIEFAMDYNCEIDIWINNLITKFCNSIGLDINNQSYIYKEMICLIDATKKRMAKYSMNYRANDLHSFFNFRSGIKITTCHSTKGDEYDVIICTGLLNGKIPNWNDIIDCSPAHQNYVARRLLYVIGSRAKKHLYLISESGHKTQKGYPYQVTPQL